MLFRSGNLGSGPVVWMDGLDSAFTKFFGATFREDYPQDTQPLYRAEGERQAMLVETIHGMRTVKALALEPTQRRVWDERTAQAVATRFSVGRVSIGARTLVSLIERLLTIAIVWIGAELVFLLMGYRRTGAFVALHDAVSKLMKAGRLSVNPIRDHVAVYVVRAYRQDRLPEPNREIAECGFFARDALPRDTTLGTQLRIAEVLDGRSPIATWRGAGDDGMM